MMFAAATAAVLITMALAVVRALMGPTVYDRIVSVNAFGTLTVVLIAVHGFLAGRPEFLDIALAYALITFIAVIAVTKYVTLTPQWRPTGKDDKGDV
jgi:multicomponent Na+:H+ antiporter subunit F